MKLKGLVSIILFFAINHGLWDYLVSAHQVSPEWASFYVYLVLAIVIGFVYRQRIVESFAAIKAELKKATFWIKRVILPMLLGYGGVLLVTYLMSAVFDINILPQNTENIKEVQATIPLSLSLLMMAVFAPVIEEAVFREAFLGWVDSKSRPVSIGMTVLSIMVFAAIHVDLSNINNWASILYYLPLSIAFAYIYIKNNRELAATILAHSITNFFAFILMLVGML